MSTDVMALGAVPQSLAAVPRPPYPLRYDVPVQERHRRLRVAFRVLLAVPYAVVVVFVGWIAYLLAVVGWFSILFAATFDRTLWEWVAGYLRRRAYLTTYLTLLRDEYPPFGDGTYPVHFEVPYPGRRSRARAFFRGLLILPQVAVISFLPAVWWASVALAWIVLLVSGEYPEGVRRLVIGLNRWLLRVEAYVLLLRDEYPPFSLGLDEVAPVPPPVEPSAPPPVLPIEAEAALMAEAEEGGGAGFHAVPWSPGPPSPGASSTDDR